MNDSGYHGIIHHKMRQYWVDETHDPNDITGKWAISVQVPGVIHKPQIFTIAVKGYDNKPDNLELNNKRPALFNTETEAIVWMNEMKFPDGTLRTVKIDSVTSHRELFHKMGAYVVKRSVIEVPRKNVDIDKIFQEKQNRQQDMKFKSTPGGIFLQ